MNRIPLPRNLFRCALAAAGLLTGPLSGGLCAANLPPEQLLRQAVDEVLTTIYDTPSSAEPLSTRIRPVLEKYFDFEYTTRSAVGRDWAKFSPEQRQKAIRLFSDLVLRTYADRFEPGNRPTITFGTSPTTVANRREIPSTITYEGQNYSVAYRLRETPAGWRFYDVLVENVSMVGNYRAQFEDLLRKGGPEALLRSLEDNLRQGARAP